MTFRNVTDAKCVNWLKLASLANLGRKKVFFIFRQNEDIHRTASGTNPFDLGIIVFSSSHLSKIPLIMKIWPPQAKPQFLVATVTKIRDLVRLRQTPSQEPRLARVNLCRTPLTSSATSTSWLPPSLLTLPHHPSWLAFRRQRPPTQSFPT